MQRLNWTVIDASVSVFWLKTKHEEPLLSRKAKHLYRDIVSGIYQVALPFHWRLEMAGCLRSFVAARRLDVNQACKAMNWLVKFAQSYCVVCEPTANWEELIAIADAWGFHLYDTLYLLLAERVQGVFWTADLRLYRQWHSRPQLRERVFVGWLGRYPHLTIPLVPP